MARGRTVSWACRLIRFFRPFVLSCFLSLIQYVYQIMNKYLKHTCSRRDKLIVLWTLNRQVQNYYVFPILLQNHHHSDSTFEIFLGLLNRFWTLSLFYAFNLSSLLFDSVVTSVVVVNCSTNLIIYFDKAFFILLSFFGMVQSTVF